MSVLKKAGAGIHAFSCRFIKILSLLFTGLLFLCGFLFTCYSLNMETQKVLTTWDSPLWNLFGIVLFVSAFAFTAHFVSHRTALAKKLLFCLVTIWMFSMGMILIVFSKTVPAADAWSVYDIASSLANGNTTVIHSTDSYLSYYPQQIGLTAFFEVLICLWNLFSIDLQAYHFIKIVYVFLGLSILYFQYRSIHLLFENDGIDCIFLLLAGSNLPFILYTSFVYGEIPSLATLSAAIYAFLHIFLPRKPKQDRTANRCIPPGYGIAALVLLTISVMLRKNSLILIIAVVLVCMIEWMQNHRHSLLVFAALCAMCAVSVLPLVQKGYELRSGSTLRSGVTATSYFAMGMQESTRAAGWYNGFNFETYRNSGMDTQLANRLSRTAMEDRFTYFREHPVYALNFYREKFLSQWADGTYACRQATLATFGGRREFFNRLYEGKYSGALIAFCNAWQNMLYLGAFLFCLAMVRNKIQPKITGLSLYLGLIGIFGGFLFHMLWEANARYIFPYSILMLPYAAAGIYYALTGFSSKIRNFAEPPAGSA